MKKNLVFLISCVVLLSLAGFASAQIQLVNPLEGQSFVGLIDGIISYISGLIASLAALMFVVAAIFYVTSAGNPGRIETAKKILISAVIGSAIALAASGLIGLVAKIVKG